MSKTLKKKKVKSSITKILVNLLVSTFRRNKKKFNQHYTKNVCMSTKYIRKNRKKPSNPPSRSLFSHLFNIAHTFRTYTYLTYEQNILTVALAFQYKKIYFCFSDELISKTWESYCNNITTDIIYIMLFLVFEYGTNPAFLYKYFLFLFLTFIFIFHVLMKILFYVVYKMYIMRSMDLFYFSVYIFFCSFSFHWCKIFTVFVDVEKVLLTILFWSTLHNTRKKNSTSCLILKTVFVMWNMTIEFFFIFYLWVKNFAVSLWVLYLNGKEDFADVWSFEENLYYFIISY